MSGASDRTVALVTGAAQGIGLGIARALAAASSRSSWPTSSASWSARSAAELAGSGLQAVGEPLDVTRADDWAASLSRPLRDGAGSTSWSTTPGSARGARSSRPTRPSGTTPSRSTSRAPGWGSRRPPLARRAGGRSSTSARPGPPGPCRGCSPTSTSKAGLLGPDPAGGGRVPGRRA